MNHPTFSYKDRVVSVAATFGAVVLFWQEGYGSEQIFGIAPTGAVLAHAGRRFMLVQD